MPWPRAVLPAVRLHGWARALCAGPQGLEAALGPMDQLQRTFDEVLVRPGRFPGHVQSLHWLAQEERQRRQRVVDQSNIGPGLQTLLRARKVVYAILSRDTAHVQVCVTRVSCGQDFLEQLSGKKPGARRLAFSDQGLLLYVLESVNSHEIPFHRLAEPRLLRWATKVRSLALVNTRQKADVAASYKPSGWT